MGFKIKPDRVETDLKTIRFPLTLIEDIEEQIRGKNTSFSAFVIQACRYALENIEDEDE